MIGSLHRVSGLEPGTVVDDSGSEAYRTALRAILPDWNLVPVSDHPAGYFRAMKAVWELVSQHQYGFLIEDDFVFTQEIDLNDLADVLDAHPILAQMILLRQPWFSNEVRAGGLIPALEELGHEFHYTGDWIEHQATFSTNPTLIRGSQFAAKRPWPQNRGSEHQFGTQIFREGFKSAYWGNGEEYVEHIGDRSGFGY